MKKIKVLLGLLVLYSTKIALGAAAQVKFFDPERGAALRYNHPVVITSGKRAFWVHNMSRLLGDKYNTESPSASAPEDSASPNDHYEILITDPAEDARAKNGSNIFFLQKNKDAKNTGVVKAGDEVKVIGLYAAHGYPKKAGILPKGRILHVENSSRLGEHELSKGLSHYDVFISDPAFKGTQDDGAVFVVQSDKSGVVYASDVLSLKNKEYDRPLCALASGRWGSKFGELVAVKGAKDTSTQLKIMLVDVDQLSDEGRANLKSTLSATLQSGLFVLDGESSPGNSPFRFNPALHGGRLRALFNNTKWRFAEAGNGHAIFDVTPNGGSIKVVLSPAPKNDDEAYVLIIGDEKNTKTKLQKAGKDLLVIDKEKAANALFSDLAKMHSFWIKIDGSTLTAGSGREVGKNEFLKFQEPDTEAAIASFFGLASSEVALFENIIVSSKELLAKLEADKKAAADKAAKDKATAEKAASDAKAAADKAAKEKASDTTEKDKKDKKKDKKDKDAKKAKDKKKDKKADPKSKDKKKDKKDKDVKKGKPGHREKHPKKDPKKDTKKNKGIKKPTKKSDGSSSLKKKADKKKDKKKDKKDKDAKKDTTNDKVE